MKRLNPILQSKWLYYLLIIVSLIYSLIYFKIPRFSKIDENDNSFVGIITNIKINGDLLTVELDNKEKIIGNYYFKLEQEKNDFIKNYHLGDKVYVKGTFSKSNNNTVFNLFNYRKYLNRKGIYYIISISSIEKIKNNEKIFYKIINYIDKRISSYKSRKYLQAFLLGKTDLIDIDIKTNYQELGVSHLLAISGMHISLFSGIILLLLKKCHIKGKISYFIAILFLLFYMQLTGNTLSVSRAVILFILLTINKILNLELSTLRLWCLTFITVVFKNPYNLFDVSFQFSFAVSFYLILLQKRLNSNNYLIGLVKVSTISLLVSLPISIYYFYQINILSIIWNLIFVPLVSLIIFPLSLISFIIPYFDYLLSFLINIMETIAEICNSFKMFQIVFGKPSIIWIIAYYIFITIYLYRGTKLGIYIVTVLALFQYFKLLIVPNNFVMMIDVGQGDSILLHMGNDTTLIDTGCKISYQKEKWQERKTKDLTDSTIIPLLKSHGIRKINNLIITHGDYDHMGEAINLVTNFKVDKVIFNCGNLNNLEKELIKVLDKKNIKYYSCISKLKIDKYKLEFLNTIFYDDENNSSSVIYLNYNNYRFLFMGDAGIEREKDILRKYNLSNIDFLKVGHHGSNTSSSEEFIDKINLKYSLISVGKNNRYGHPKEEVLDNLSNSRIYRTDLDGSIEIKLKKNGYKIRICSP